MLGRRKSVCVPVPLTRGDGGAVMPDPLRDAFACARGTRLDRSTRGDRAQIRFERARRLVAPLGTPGGRDLKHRREVAR